MKTFLGRPLKPQLFRRDRSLGLQRGRDLVLGHPETASAKPAALAEAAVLAEAGALAAADAEGTRRGRRAGRRRHPGTVTTDKRSWRRSPRLPPSGRSIDHVAVLLMVRSTPTDLSLATEIAVERRCSSALRTTPVAWLSKPT